MLGASTDVLGVIISLERRKGGEVNEIRELEKIIYGMSAQMENKAKTGYFLFGHNVYIPWEPMLEAQWRFSTEHDGLAIESPHKYEELFTEIRKMFHVFDRLRVNGEREGEIDRAVDYLCILHSYLLHATDREHRRRFA